MEEKELDFLSNIIYRKKITDDLLEEQILENEQSFEFICSKKINNELENNENSKNIDEKQQNNNNNEKNSKKEEKINHNKTNEFKNESLKKQNSSHKNINIIKKNDNNRNKKNDDKEHKNFNMTQIQKDEKNNVNKTIDNMKKYNKKNFRENSINSIDSMNKDKDKKRKIRVNKSVDYKKNKNNYDDLNLSIYNRFNIYQRLFDLKKINYNGLNLKQDKTIFNSNYNFNNPKKSEINSPSIKEIFSDDEIIQNHNNYNKIYKKINTKKNNIISKRTNSDITIKHAKYNNENKYSNKSQIEKEYLEDDILSFKSKKSRANRQSSLNSSMTKTSTEKFFQTYERFKENQQKQKEKLEYMKKVLEDKEKKTCYFKPKINKNSIEIKDDFYTRQQKKLENVKKKNDELRLKLKKKEEKELYINNISKNRRNLNASQRIKKLYEWDKNRKNKIQERRKSANELINKKMQEKPKIDKNSRQLVLLNYHKYINKPSIDNKKNLNLKDKDFFFERLYLHDIEKRKEKRKMLTQIYSPSFTPYLYKHTNINRNHSEKHEYCHTKNGKVISNKNKDKNNDDIKNYRNYFGLNEDCAEQIRDKIFKHKKTIKNNRNNSAVNLMSINNIMNEEKNGDDKKYFNRYTIKIKKNKNI
jgi:hypothetical protein